MNLFNGWLLLNDHFSLLYFANQHKSRDCLHNFSLLCGIFYTSVSNPKFCEFSRFSVSRRNRGLRLYLQNHKEFEAEILDLQLEKYGLSFDIKKFTTSGWALGDENVIGKRSFNMPNNAIKPFWDILFQTCFIDKNHCFIWFFPKMPFFKIWMEFAKKKNKNKKTLIGFLKRLQIIRNIWENVYWAYLLKLVVFWKSCFKNINFWNFGQKWA